MASFIPNFNAPSQNYGNILNMSYRRGMDPRKRRKLAARGRPAGARVETNPDGTQVSTTAKSRREEANAKARANADEARKKARRKVVEKKAERATTDALGLVNRVTSLATNPVASTAPVPAANEAIATPSRTFSEGTPQNKPRRAAVRFDPSWEFAQGRGPKPSINPNPNAPGSPLVATPEQQFINTRPQRQFAALSRMAQANEKTQGPFDWYSDPSRNPSPFQTEGKGVGGVPAVNETVARMNMSPEDRRYLDEQDFQRQVAGLLYSFPTGLVNWYSSIFD